MIRYTHGNLLETRADALVNTVNEVGVMGKGIALMFLEAFPQSARAYQDAAKRGEIHVGRVLVTENEALLGPRFIIHFPTKKHWRHPSKLVWVREGLADLTRVVREKGIHSIALPPLGCGNGGLDWVVVRREIEAALSEIPDIEAIVFEPTSRYQNVPKRPLAPPLS
jgi:O-acetyl-ADP-ribose deacetylase (regulator of RNase III)